MLRTTTLVAALTLSLAAHAATQRYHAVLNGASDVPPKSVQGTGAVHARLDTATRKLTWTATWKGLTGPVTAAHFHGPAAAGSNGPVALSWGQAPDSPFKGSATLTPTQMSQLQAGQWYANLHTEQNKAGEIRGQMVRGR